MAKARNEDRQQRKAAQRAADERRQRRNSMVLRAAAIGAIVLTAAVAYSFYHRGQLLSAVKETSYPAGMHLAGSISYTETPPMGGPHNVVWQNCGIYETPIHSEHAVHSLEHGAIWITYRPGLAPEQIAKLRSFAADDFMLLSPYPGLPQPIVASAWNHQLTFANADDPALPAFIAEYKNNPRTTPEFGAACAGATSAPATADSLNGGNALMTR
jgi:hypothetical protein